MKGSNLLSPSLSTYYFLLTAYHILLTPYYYYCLPFATYYLLLRCSARSGPRRHARVQGGTLPQRLSPSPVRGSITLMCFGTGLVESPSLTPHPHPHCHLQPHPHRHPLLLLLLTFSYLLLTTKVLGALGSIGIRRDCGGGGEGAGM